MRFLFVHGSWHGAWCWHKILPRIAAEGHEAVAPDLPGRGKAPAGLRTVGLQRIVDRLAANLHPTEKTTLVVHSRYGIAASSLAERYPTRIARTIYLASYMVPPGMRGATVFRRDDDSFLKPFVGVSRWGLYDWLNPAAYVEGLYHDCSADDVALARSLLCREPLRPTLSSVRLTEERYGSVHRAYIRLAQDRAVSPMVQDWLLNQTPVDRVETLDASHSAYFSQPDALAQTIMKLAAS